MAEETKHWQDTIHQPLLPDKPRLKVYIADLTNADVVAGKQPHVKPVPKDRYLAGDDKRDTDVSLSLLWPKNAFDRSCGFPFGVAAITAFLVAPAVDPSLTFGAAALAGYAAGGVANYMQLRIKPTKATDKENKPKPAA
jgi:hypothetical protein